jgi:DNA-binding transcriptional ArsR family regulator
MLNSMEAPTSEQVFRAISHPTRRSLLDQLRDGETEVCELVSPSYMSRPALSQHLKILREAGLVRAQREGPRTIYSLNPEPLRCVYHWAKRHEAFLNKTRHNPGSYFDPRGRKT